MAVKITGNTFPVKEQLKALGGKWNGAEKCWEVPDDKADQAWALVGGKPAAKPAAPVKPAPVAAPKTPQEAADQWYSPKPATLVGELRGMPVFVKAGNLKFAVDANLKIRSIHLAPGNPPKMAAANGWGEDVISEEEFAPLREPIRAAAILAKTEADRVASSSRNYVGELRGRKVYREPGTPMDALILEGEVENAYLRIGANSYEIPDPEAPIRVNQEEISAADAAAIRPLIRQLVADARLKKQAEQQARIDQKAQRVAKAIAEDRYHISGGSGYGSNGWSEGQVLLNNTHLWPVDEGCPEYLYVVKSSQRYYREDGMSFGVGDESGYVYQATCRAATPAEAAPVIARREAKDRAKAAAAELKSVAATVKNQGERPEGHSLPEGETVRIGEGQDIYGGGDWFVLGQDWIWYVMNNGRDGDDWSFNNVRTGGAGAIGWRVPATAELAEKIRRLASASPKPEL